MVGARRFVHQRDRVREPPAVQGHIGLEHRHTRPLPAASLRCDARGEAKPILAPVLVPLIPEDRARTGERRTQRRDRAAGRMQPRPRARRSPSPGRCPTRRGRRPAAAPGPSPSTRCRRRGPARAPGPRTRPAERRSPPATSDSMIMCSASLRSIPIWGPPPARWRAARGARGCARSRRRSEPRPTPPRTSRRARSTAAARRR